MTDGNTVQKTAYISTAVENAAMWIACGAVSIFGILTTKSPRWGWVMVLPILGAVSLKFGKDDEKET